MDTVNFLLLEDAQKAGIGNKKSLNIAAKVFIDLSEVRGWWNVKLHTKKDVDVVFISGHHTRHEPRQLVLPLSSNEMVSPMKINQYLNQIKLDDYNTEGLTLAICDPDTTTVYYKVSEGLVPPESPESTDANKFERYQIFQKRKADLDENVEEYTNRMKRKLEDG